MEVKGITIHNMSNFWTARQNFEFLKKTGQLDLCHYLVDDKEIIQTIPEEQMAYHTGKGYDYGNRCTLAVEICRDMDKEEIYKKAEEKAVDFIKELMAKYHLTASDLYFHMDFNPQTRCPHRILQTRTKEEFINEYFV